MPEVVRKLGVTERSHCRWKREYGVLQQLGIEADKFAASPGTRAGLEMQG